MCIIIIKLCLIFNLFYFQSKLAALEDIDEHLISLYSQGEPLNNDQVVGELNNLNIDFIVPLLGGNLMLIILVLKYN